MTTYPELNTPPVNNNQLALTAKHAARILIDGFGSDPQLDRVQEVVRDEGLNESDSILLDKMVQKLISTATTTITLNDKALEEFAL